MDAFVFQNTYTYWSPGVDIAKNNLLLSCWTAFLHEQNNTVDQQFQYFQDGTHRQADEEAKSVATIS